MWDRLHSPARSAIATFGSPAVGAKIILAWSDGLTISRRVCGPLRQQRSKAEEPPAQRTDARLIDGGSPSLQAKAHQTNRRLGGASRSLLDRALLWVSTAIRNGS